MRTLGTQVVYCNSNMLAYESTLGKGKLSVYAYPEQPILRCMGSEGRMLLHQTRRRAFDVHVVSLSIGSQKQDGIKALRYNTCRHLSPLHR